MQTSIFQDEYGFIPLHTVSQYGHVAITQILLDCGSLRLLLLIHPIPLAAIQFLHLHGLLLFLVSSTFCVVCVQSLQGISTWQARIHLV